MLIDDEAKASEYLQRIGYYRLSAYWYPMRQRTGSKGDTVEDNFVPGTTFKEATDLYTFDGRLRLIVMDALERIEVSLRTEVALTLGRHGPRAYRDPTFFDSKFNRPIKGSGPTKHREWLQRFDKRFLESKDAFAEHFRRKYPGDDMPIWIAVELLDFGALSHLISGLKYRDKVKIGESYGGIAPNELQSWVRSMAFVRNVCAHHARLWNKPLVNSPALTGKDVPRVLKHAMLGTGSGSRFYSVACVMRYLLKHANPRTSWKDRFVSHIETFPISPRISISALGLPENWSSQELWE